MYMKPSNNSLHRDFQPPKKIGMASGREKLEGFIKATRANDPPVGGQS
jgi:hypothetical protein